jgi:putative transcriptional regulator
MTKRKSRILESVHETAQGLHSAGVMDPMTLKEFDALCLTPKREYNPAEIRHLRERLNVSQAVLAAYIGVGRDTVAHWEQGVAKPRGPALKLLNLAEKKGLEAIA